MGTLRVTRKQLELGVKIPLDERTTIIVGPDMACITVHGRMFDATRSFVLPRALNALTDAFRFACGIEAKACLSVAHTNAAGDTGENEKLSKARAQVVAAWVDGDVARWLENYQDGVAEALRWGLREDHLMIGALEDIEPVNSNSIVSSPNQGGVVRDPVVKAYQAARGLQTDGIAGPITRKQLVTDYFALSRKAQPAADADNAAANDAESTEAPKLPFTTEAHGAGPHFSLSKALSTLNAALGEAPEESDAEQDVTQQDERIDLFFFMNDSGVDPAPSTASGPQYLEWCKQVSLHKLVSLSAAGADGNTKIALELFDKSGRIRHARQRFRINGADSFEGTTDEFGRIVLHEVPPGDFQLELELTFLEPPHDFTENYELPVLALAAGTVSPQVRLIGAVPRCQMASVGGLNFDTNKSFLLPAAAEELQTVRALYQRHQGGHLLVVGHTDTTSNAAVNDPLSVERADATLAYLRDDVDAWLAFYEDSVPEGRRWGSDEDLQMIRALPDFDPEEPLAPVVWFQRTRGLQEDGEAGPITRKQLIAEYMARDGVDLDDFVLEADTHGCGENFPVDESGELLDTAPADDTEDRLDRRVELFFFDKEFGVLPPAPGKNSKAGSTEYPEWRRRAQEENAPDFGGEKLALRLHSDASIPLNGGRYRVIKDGATLFERDSEEGWAIIPRKELKKKGLVLQWGAAGDSTFGFELTLASVFNQTANTERARARLKNLGYAIDTDEVFAKAVERFERDYLLTAAGLVAGEVADATVKFIDEIYATECDATPPERDASDGGTSDGGGDEAGSDVPGFVCPESLEGPDAEEVLTTLSFRAKDAAGNPIAGETVLVRFANGQELEAKLDDTGFVSFDPVPDGKAKVSFPQLPPGSWSVVSST